MVRTLVFVMACWLVGPCLAQSSEGPRNVLLLYADDWRFDTLGCAGHPIIQTPNLDKLAGESIRFTDSYVTTAICGVSRASLLTGQWMSRHGCTGFEPFDTPWEQTYPGLLRDQGYWVGHVGKWHNGPFPAERYDFGRAYHGRHIVKDADGKPIHVTQKNEQDAIDFLRSRPGNKPFCLTVAFFAPHAEDANPEQYIYQASSAPLYEDVQIPTPVLASMQALHALPAFIAAPANEGRIRWHWRFDTPEKFQKYVKAYYRLITEVDHACGNILAELKAQGLEDRTLVIFTTDNGYFLGERQLADKWYPYEESIRVPLIVRDPDLRADQRGSTDAHMVLNVDLAPLILGAAGIAPPPGMQGRDLSVLYKGEAPGDWRDEFFYEHPTISNRNRIPTSKALVRKDMKYVFWPEFGHEQLFDLRDDPLELKNRAGEAGYAEARRRLRDRMNVLEQGLAGKP